MNFDFFWELLKSSGALWLGVYILTRGGSQGRSGITAMALILWSLSPFSMAMAGVSDAAGLRFWLPFLVGVWPITVSCIGAMALSLAGEVLDQAWQPRLRTAYHALIMSGVVLGSLAAFTALVFDYATIDHAPERAIDSNFAAVGSAEALYIAYLNIIPLITVAILTWVVIQAWRNHSENARGLNFMAAASWAWLIGLLLQRYITRESINASDLVFNHLSDPIFALAVALFGWGMVQHNALIRGRIMRSDFLLSLSGLGMTVLVFAILPWLVGRWLYRFDQPVTHFLLLSGTWLAIWSHMLINYTRRWLERVLIGGATTVVHEQVEEVIQASREGVPLSDTFDELAIIRKKALVHEHVNKQLLRSLNTADGLDQLAASPLQELDIVRQNLPAHATDRQKSAEIITLLEKAYLGLVSAEVAPSNRQRELLEILKLRLQDGLDRSTIPLRLHMHPRKYDRLLSDGITQLADVILELENEKSRITNVE